MNTLRIKNKIFSKLKEKLTSISVSKDIKDLLTGAKQKVVVFYSGDSATTFNETNQRFKVDYDFQILIDTRNLKSDDEALDLRDSIVSALHGLKVDEIDSYDERIFYQSSRFEEFAPDTGIWTHKLVFRIKRDLFIATENL